MEGAFFGVLATAASVFIGILTALLTIDFTHLIQYRDRMKQRYSQANSRISSLESANEEYSENLQKFAEGSLEEIEGIYEKFKEGQELTQADLAIAAAFETETKEAVGDLQPLLKYQTIHIIIDNKSEIDALEMEKREIENDLESLEFQKLRNSLYTNIIASILSILIPLATYHELIVDWLDVQYFPTFTHETIVFILWLSGLILVFGRLWIRIQSIEMPNLSEGSY